jgi:hypothetical protein
LKARAKAPHGDIIGGKPTHIRAYYLSLGNWRSHYGDDSHGSAFIKINERWKK